MTATASDPLRLGAHVVASRLVLGAEGFAHPALLGDAVLAAGTDLVALPARPDVAALAALRQAGVALLPRVAGAAREAVAAARAAREALETDLVLLDVDGDDLLDIVRALAADGASVLAPADGDAVLARRLGDAGCAGVLVAGAPAGSGLGVRDPHGVARVVAAAEVPVVLAGGIGTASHAALAMELGCDAVLAASAVALAEDPASMAAALAAGVEGGRLARGARRREAVR